MCRPDALNAQSVEMLREMRDIGRELPGDVRVVIVRGEGRAFSAGLDLVEAAMSGEGLLSDLAAAPAGEADVRLSQFQEAFNWLRRPDLISIAAVQGFAIGAGFQLALACDFRVLADDVRLVMAEAGLGLVPDLGGTKRLVELVGYARALEICVTGRHIFAGESERIGLATTVVPVEDLDVAVRDLAESVLVAPRQAVVEIKALLARAGLHDFADQQEKERAAQLRRVADLAGRGE